MSKEEVDEAFAAWAIDARRLSGTGPDTRALIGALGGVRVLTHLCERSVNRDADVVDDALVSLNHLSVDDEAVEDLVCLGGLQVLADLLIDEEMPIKVHSHAAQLISKVLLNDELRLAFLDLGVVPSLVRLLKVSRCCPAQHIPPQPRAWWLPCRAHVAGGGACSRPACPAARSRTRRWWCAFLSSCSRCARPTRAARTSAASGAPPPRPRAIHVRPLKCRARTSTPRVLPEHRAPRRQYLLEPLVNLCIDFPETPVRPAPAPAQPTPLPLMHRRPRQLSVHGGVTRAARPRAGAGARACLGPPRGDR